MILTSTLEIKKKRCIAYSNTFSTRPRLCKFKKPSEKMDGTNKNANGNLVLNMDIKIDVFSILSKCNLLS